MTRAEAEALFAGWETVSPAQYNYLMFCGFQRKQSIVFVPLTPFGSPAVGDYRRGMLAGYHAETYIKAARQYPLICADLGIIL